jgi:hypothetical protein
MVLNNYLEWKKTFDLTQEVSRGEYVDVQKVNAMFTPKIQIARYVGTLGDFMAEKEFQKILAEIRKNAVDVEVEIAKAVSKTLPLRSENVEVVKTMENVEEPLILKLPKVALHGGDVHRLMSWRVLREMIENAES